MNEEQVKILLSQVQYPGFSRDIVSFGLIRDIQIDGSTVKVQIAVTTANHEVPKKISTDVKEALEAANGIDTAEVQIAVTQPKQAGAPTGQQGGAPRNKIRDVRHCIAVASGKGGVGKSTFSVNLACAIEKRLAAKSKPNGVGLLDCDIYGPSIPLMIGINERPNIENDEIIPLENFGVRVMSMGFLVDENTPVVWRGPMITKTIVQFLQNVKWGETEILVIDLPPGTGDAQLTLVQSISLDGAVVVTTPQSASVNVARRGALMFDKVNVPILGVAENMSYLADEKTGEKNYLFGQGGGQNTADFLETKLLGQVPLHPDIRQGGDNGIPIVISSENAPAAQEFFKIADQILESLEIS